MSKAGTSVVASYRSPCPGVGDRLPGHLGRPLLELRRVPIRCGYPIGDAFIDMGTTAAASRRNADSMRTAEGLRRDHKTRGRIESDRDASQIFAKRLPLGCDGRRDRANDYLGISTRNKAGEDNSQRRAIIAGDSACEQNAVAAPGRLWSRGKTRIGGFEAHAVVAPDRRHVLQPTSELQKVVGTGIGAHTPSKPAPGKPAQSPRYGEAAGLEREVRVHGRRNAFKSVGLAKEVQGS